VWNNGRMECWRVLAQIIGCIPGRQVHFDPDYITLSGYLDVLVYVNPGLSPLVKLLFPFGEIISTFLGCCLGKSDKE
jgi:hypothetical protein